MTHGEEAKGKHQGKRKEGKAKRGKERPVEETPTSFWMAALSSLEPKTRCHSDAARDDTNDDAACCCVAIQLLATMRTPSILKRASERFPLLDLSSLFLLNWFLLAVPDTELCEQMTSPIPRCSFLLFLFFFEWGKTERCVQS